LEGFQVLESTVPQFGWNASFRILEFRITKVRHSLSMLRTHQPSAMIAKLTVQHFLLLDIDHTLSVHFKQNESLGSINTLIGSSFFIHFCSNRVNQYQLQN